MKPGAKGEVTVDPLDFSDYPEDRAERRLRFIAEYLRVPKGFGAGEPVVLRDFQVEIIRGAFAPGVRTGLVSMPRANGKTALAAMLAVAELFVGDTSAEVLVVASDQRQAEITMRMAAKMIASTPELAERAHVLKDRIRAPQNDGLLLPLPADPAALHGHDPSLLICDELHVVTEGVWEAVSSVTGKRPESLTLAISTPATSTDSIMWRLVQYGRENRDPAFWLREWAAPDGCDLDDRAAWLTANPALACERPFLAEDGLSSVLHTLREPQFRQLRLGQWVAGADSWLEFGMWEGVADEGRAVEPRERVVLAFDGSASGDSTALVGCTVGADPHVFVVGLWENPGDLRWRVPRREVDEAVAAAFKTYNVVEMACDPWGWRTEIETWAGRHGRTRVVEWNTAAASRMAPATDRFYQLVAEERLTHDGDPRLAAHMSHCVARRTPMGDVVTKDKSNSPRKIDAAVGAIVAVDRAAHHARKKTKARSFAA